MDTNSVLRPPRLPFHTVGVEGLRHVELHLGDGSVDKCTLGRSQPSGWRVTARAEDLWDPQRFPGRLCDSCHRLHVRLSAGVDVSSPILILQTWVELHAPSSFRTQPHYIRRRCQQPLKIMIPGPPRPFIPHWPPSRAFPGSLSPFSGCTPEKHECVHGFSAVTTYPWKPGHDEIQGVYLLE